MSPYIRTVKTASGTTAVQIVHSTRRGMSPSVETTLSPTPTVTKAATIVLSSEGIGPFQFGAPEKDVLGLLKPVLGTPKVQGQVGGCEGAGWLSVSCEVRGAEDPVRRDGRPVDVAADASVVGVEVHRHSHGAAGSGQANPCRQVVGPVEGPLSLGRWT